jgi:hypothetical protein
MLEGKAKEEFEKWIIDRQNSIYNEWFFNTDIGGLRFYDHYWIKIPPSMQYGVYVDFFDSVGIVLDVIKTDFNKKFNLQVYVGNSDIEECSDGINTRPEARTAAIKKANEIYNERL